MHGFYVANYTGAIIHGRLDLEKKARTTTYTLTLSFVPVKGKGKPFQSYVFYPKKTEAKRVMALDGFKYPDSRLRIVSQVQGLRWTAAVDSAHDQILRIDLLN